MLKPGHVNHAGYPQVFSCNVIYLDTGTTGCDIAITVVNLYTSTL